MNHQGFSLVELSIVLVILGLLTGGILSGQSLIRAAELRTVSTDFNKYITAVHSFRDKYRAIPGDMPNAIRFWGAADGASGDGLGADCFTVNTSTASDPKVTCNGNGTGFINDPAGGTGVWIYGERWHAWKHLANAGLVEGTYTGISNHATNNNIATGGLNVPAGKISNSVFGLATLAAADVTYFNPTGSFANVLIASATGSIYLLAEEAWNIDTKLDDGKPTQGKITSIHFSHVNGGNCASSAVMASAEYQLANTNKGCSLAYFF